MRRSTLRMMLPSSTIECSISQPDNSQFGPIAVKGPMYASRTEVPGPMTAGPRTVLAVIEAPSFDDDRADERRFRVDLPVDPALQRTEDEPVGLEQVVFLAGIDPVVTDGLGADVKARVDQPLDGVRDLELASRGRNQRRRDLVHLGSEVVDTDHREIRHGLSRFLDQPQNPTVRIKHGDAKRRRVVDPAQQDLRRTGLFPEPLGVGNDPSTKKVVAEEHAEGRIV